MPVDLALRGLSRSARLALSVRATPGMDQSAQPGERRGSAGAQREVEQMTKSFGDSSDIPSGNDLPAFGTRQSLASDSAIAPPQHAAPWWEPKWPRSPETGNLLKDIAECSKFWQLHRVAAA